MQKVVHVVSYLLQLGFLMAICLSHLILFSSKARKTLKLGVSDEFFACEKYMIFNNKKIMIYKGNRTDYRLNWTTRCLVTN